MSTPLNIGVVGLGVMGQRMLDRIEAHPRLQTTIVWDADAQALQRTMAARPALRAAGSAEQLIATPGLHSLYVATPPAAHMALSHVAFDAGLAVLCEKPLTVDFGAAQRCIDRIAREGQRAAVNYSLASSSALQALQQAFGAGLHSLGALQLVDIDVGFAAWPRPWQAAAGPWLAQRTEGGFVREVLSHFVFLLQRVLGPATAQASEVAYPADGLGAETALQARLQVAGVPVTISGRVDASLPQPEFNRMRWQGSEGAIELREWFALSRRQQGGDWAAVGDAAVMRAAGQAAQLEQWVAMIEGPRPRTARLCGGAGRAADHRGPAGRPLNTLNSGATCMAQTGDTHSKTIGYLLWIFGFTGSHRFYYGKPITGTIWFFTLGLLGIGWLIDLFLIPSMDRQADFRFQNGPVNYSVAWLLLTFLGLFGVHRMYMGKWLTGILYLLTVGLFGLGYLYDYWTLNDQVNLLNRMRE
jgi:predicted dehydrogenase/TM2 domain-containing membrane protein YozV